ncbi:hypothetical protein FRC17_006176 [Serendipita sp. 399]|nr:hypothetical protein FRC17_006176 [Serendipita sp. 399]
MSSPPNTGIRTSRRKRKSQKVVVDSDNEVESSQNHVDEDATVPSSFSPSKAMASLIVQEGKDDEFTPDENIVDEDVKMGSPKKQPAQTKRGAAITRRAKKRGANTQTEAVESSESFQQTTVVIEMTEESQGTTSVIETTVTTTTSATISFADTLGDPWAVDSKTPPTPSASVTTEGGQKRKESGSNLTEGKASGLPERPTKRQKLPTMRRNPNIGGAGSDSAASSSTKMGGGMSASGKPAGGLGRQIVDGPVTKDIDLRNEDAFAQLFKKTGSGKADTRYDLTSSERLEQKQAELNKLKEEYIAKKAQTKAATFDLGEQNRKLAEVEVGSPLLCPNRIWKVY